MRAHSEPLTSGALHTATAGTLPAYCGLTEAEIAALAGVPRVLVFDEVGSTMDAAHDAATAGAPAGTLVLAERQLSGRGRGGRAWRSDPGVGVWLTLIERPAKAVPVQLLSIRAGLALAAALDRFSTAPVELKWPNDLQVRGKKLGGILIEARWRDARAEWVAIGVGINIVAPVNVDDACGLADDATAPDVLAAITPALRAAAAEIGPLSKAELDAFARRDAIAGRRCVQPAVGVVLGISDSGELLVRSGEGVSAHRSGSLVLEGAQ